MVYRWQKIFAWMCLFFLAATIPAAAKTRTENEAAPVKALRTLYAGNEELRNTIDQAFAAIQDKKNPWYKKDFQYLCRFFNEWFYLLPVNNSPTQDEFEYIKKFSWFYHRNEAGQRFVGREPGLSWTRDFVAARGKFLDSKESTGTVKQWLDDSSLNNDQYVVPPEGFQSFNEFFTRNLKPGARTVAAPDDDSVIVAPTDCMLNIIDPVTGETNIPTKLNQKLNVRELMAGSEYAKFFESGTAISCILLPDTYHHYHAVATGDIVESREDIAGSYWGIDDLTDFLNRGNIGYGRSYSVFEHFRRGYFVIKTKEHGHVAMIPVGLDTIGSVVFENKYKKVTSDKPVPVRKGEKLGHFAYGGSLVITLTEKSIGGISVPQGQQIGIFKRK